MTAVKLGKIMYKRFLYAEFNCLYSAFFLPLTANYTLEKLKVVTSPERRLASHRIGSICKVITAAKLWVLYKSRGHKKQR